MKTTLLLALALVGAACGQTPPATVSVPNGLGISAFSTGTTTTLVGAKPAGEPNKSYPPGGYGKVKNAPMFICWREWDGEIRLGGVAKSLSTPFMLTDATATEDFFSVESSGSNGTTNKEHLLLCSDATTLLEFKQNYQGRIVVHREPTITKKPDGSWEITFAEKKAEPVAKSTVEWIGSPMVSDDDKYTPSTGWIKHREIGLRSDGCVVWRERK